MSPHDASLDVTSATSAVWTRHVAAPGTPEGFTVRTAFPGSPDGAEMMLERWQPDTAEPPHSHPGDDMTVVVEGRLTVQFYRWDAGALVADGAPVVLSKGDVGYIRAGRVHDARYIDACKLVYVHDGPFAFQLAEAPPG